MSASSSRAAAQRPLALASRALAAIAGGYAVAAAASVAAAVALPLPRSEAVVSGMLFSFAVHAGAVVWVFAAATAARAWLGLLASGGVLAAVAWLAPALAEGAP